MTTVPGVRRRSRMGMILLIALLSLVLGQVAGVSAQTTQQVVWDSYNVDMEVRDDGTVRVTETQVVEFNGRFSTGFADIPLTGLESINNLEVRIGVGTDSTPEPAEYVPRAQYDNDPGTYTYTQTAQTLELDYAFPPTSRTGGENSRVIILQYDVAGAIRVYEDLEPANQQLRWVAISSEVTDVAPIRNATASIILPEQVDPEQTVSRPDGVETDGRTFTWTRQDLGPGDELEVNLQFPPITDAQVPAWQERSDQIREQQLRAEEQSAVAGTVFLGAGLLLLVGGLVLLYGIWYTRGRDPEIGLVADIVAEPPDDLRPGAAGTLIDEQTHTRDVIATVFDLARRGVIRMDETKTAGFMGFGRQRTYTLTLLDHQTGLKHYEEVLLDALFGPGAEDGTSVTMDRVQQTFAQRATEIHNGFYDELVEHGYFDASPENVRQRANALRLIGPAVAAIVIVLVLMFVGASSGWIILPIIAAVVLYIAGGKVATNMPRKTMKGAEAAALWKAFKRYLQEIDEHENLEESKAIFEKYLPYATAFGLENSWIQKFSQVSTQMPPWFGGGMGPVMTGSGGYGRRRQSPFGGGVWVFPSGGTGTGTFGGGSATGAGGSDGGGMNMPDLQGTSDAAGRSLQGGSDSIFDMLGTASDIFGGGSGRSGGGSFGSWGGGGGGFGGFSGGGGFGGGGGGGGRGFG